jgi:hypothetical protein
VDDLPKALLWLAISFTFAAIFVWNHRRGKSIVRLPFPTTRDDDPLWFWFGQFLFAILAIAFLFFAIAESVPQTGTN